MPKISKQKQERIAEQILHYLFSISPEAKFTSDIAKEIARDEEFIKYLLNDLKIKKLVLEVKKNPNGEDYIKRQRWRITPEAHQVFKKAQEKTQLNNNNIYNSEEDII
jgi:predicted transcriptional regulator with HTH domain